MNDDPYADRRPPRRPGRTDAELRAAVKAVLQERPGVSAYEIHKAVGGGKGRVLAVVRELRPVAPETPHLAVRRRNREAAAEWRRMFGDALDRAKS